MHQWDLRHENESPVQLGNVQVSLFGLVSRNSAGSVTDLGHASETTFRFQTFITDRYLVGVKRWVCPIHSPSPECHVRKHGELHFSMHCSLRGSPYAFSGGRSMRACRNRIKGSSKTHKKDLSRFTYPPFGYELSFVE